MATETVTAGAGITLDAGQAEGLHSLLDRMGDLILALQSITQIKPETTEMLAALTAVEACARWQDETSEKIYELLGARHG